MTLSTTIIIRQYKNQSIQQVTYIRTGCSYHNNKYVYLNYISLLFVISYLVTLGRKFDPFEVVILWKLIAKKPVNVRNTLPNILKLVSCNHT